MSGALASRDLQLVLLMPEHGDEARTVRYLTGGHVDGALLVSLHGEDPIPAALAARGVPFVFVGRPPAIAGVSYVDTDNRQGGRRATRHLIEGGRRRVATVTGPIDMAAGADRLEGYREALRGAGLGAGRGARRGAATSPRRAGPPPWSGCWPRPRTSTVCSARRT